MKKPKNYALALDNAEAKRQRDIRKRIAELKGPMTLAQVRDALVLTYDDLSLAIDSTDRGYAYKLCLFRHQPAWGYAKHIEKVTRGVVPAVKVMEG